MDNNPLISVIMPAYGIELFIGDAIESVLKQSYGEWELIVVNDGSKDGSRDIAKKYEKIDSRITVIDKENGGLSDARNIGLLHAKGDFVHFFDGDDRIDEDYYSQLASRFVLNADIIVSGYSVVYELGKGEPRITTRLIQDLELDSSREALEHIQRFLNYAWNKLFRRSFLISHNLFYEKGLYSIEDAEFMSRVFEYDPSIVYSTSTGYQYVQRDRNSLGRLFNSELINLNIRRIEVENKMVEILRKQYGIGDDFHYPILNVYKSLFHALFFFTEPMSKQDYLAHINDITSNQILRSYLRKVKATSIVELLNKALIEHRMNSVILLLYTIGLKKTRF